MPLGAQEASNMRPLASAKVTSQLRPLREDLLMPFGGPGSLQHETLGFQKCHLPAATSVGGYFWEAKMLDPMALAVDYGTKRYTPRASSHNLSALSTFQGLVCRCPQSYVKYEGL